MELYNDKILTNIPPWQTKLIRKLFNLLFESYKVCDACNFSADVKNYKNYPHVLHVLTITMCVM